MFNAAKSSPGQVSGSEDRLVEGEAIYFSRRGGEERQAAITAKTRKSRETHLQLAEAYELRAHILTQRLNLRGAAEQCCEN